MLRYASPMLLALLPAALAANDTCPPSGAAHIIVARGSDEPPGFGIIGNVSQSVVDLLPGSTQEWLDYPASFDNYFPSEADGVVDMKDAVTTFIKDCPGAAVVCMGYSQGAQLIGDALIGQADKFMPSDTNATVNASLPSSALSQIAAVILMGDPARNDSAQTAFHVGNSSNNGLFPRTNSDLFDKYGLTSKIQSYCDSGDRYCDSGNSSAVHDGYVPEYGAQAAKFVVDQVKSFSGNSSSGSNSTGSATSTAAAASGTSASGTGSGSGSSTATGTGAASASSGASSSQPTTGGAEVLRPGAGEWKVVVGLVAAFAAGLAL